MTETANARDDPSAHRPLIERALSFEGSLRSRTEGVTWALWGMVLALVFFMYGSMGEFGHEPPLWTNILWVPWILVGALLTWILWRSAALSLAARSRHPAGAWVTIAWVAAITAGLSIFSFSSRFPNPESTGILAIGIAWLLMGATNLFRATPLGRRVTIVIGLGLALVGLALSLLLPPPSAFGAAEGQARFLQGFLQGCLVALVPLAAGLWQALRG